MYRRFISSLLCVCVCVCVLFSSGVDAYATDLSVHDRDPLPDEIVDLQYFGTHDSLADGYNAFMSYYYGSSSYDLYLGWTIQLPEVLSAGQPLDFSCRIDFDGLGLDYASYNHWIFRAYDANGNQLFSFNSHSSDKLSCSVAHEGYKYSVSDFSCDSPISYFRIYHNIGTSTLEEVSTLLFDVNISERSSVGLLSGIISVIGDIFNAIINLPSNIASALSYLFNMVVDAVNSVGSAVNLVKSAVDSAKSAVNKVKTAVVDVKNTVFALCDRLLDGIKSLFIPTESDLTAYSDKWQSLLRNRFGALYECADLISSSVAEISDSVKVSMFQFPEVTLDFNGVPWKFGGWIVKPVPDGFTGVRDILSNVVSIVCTLAFLSGLKNRFERLLET